MAKRAFPKLVSEGILRFKTKKKDVLDRASGRVKH